MYIKSITLDGFKSYAEKTEVSGFDPQFNAITGLNGSGKSNILDSICFVLGIQNLSHVRATSLTELVYKNGQAGISKATVTIKFDNTDPSTAPVGYDSFNFRELVVSRTVITGGKTKYTINGNNANNNRIHDLFQSVQLNVNNPHFLIMQGRITKVMNMKPMEILSMVEEAAGTRMYEDKKGNALKNLEKKESRLREINELLETHICPQMEKLKEERKECIEFNRIVRDFEQLEKICIAWDFVRTEELVKKASENQKELVENNANLKKGIAEDELKVQEISEKIDELEKKTSEEGGSKLKELEDELNKRRLAETKADTQVRNLKELLNDEIKKKTEHENNLKEEKDFVAQHQKELSNASKKLEKLKESRDKDAATVDAAEEHFLAVNAGVGDNNEEASLAMQLMNAKKELAGAETETKSTGMILNHKKKEVAQLEAQIKTVDKNYAKDKATYQKVVDEVQALKNEAAKLNYDEENHKSLVAQLKTAKEELLSLQDKLERLYSNFPVLDFQFVDPTKNFNRSSVMGPVCGNFELKDQGDALALETVAGGKLYNVIVDNEETGKHLLARGQLRRRVTLIPLNKINAHVIADHVVKKAKTVAGAHNVSPAIDRISTREELMPAMSYVFGGCFVCSSMETAQKVTFDPSILTRSVTLEGDVFDPSGTLSGGSTGRRGELLKNIFCLPELKKAIAEKEDQIDQLQRQLVVIEKLKNRQLQLFQQYDIKESEAELLKSRIENSIFHQKVKDVETLKQEIESHESRLIELKEKQKSLDQLIKELEVKTSKAVREKKLKDAQNAVADAKKAAAISQEKFNKCELEVNSLKLEIESALNAFPAIEEQIKASEKSIKECELKYQEAQENKKNLSVTVAEMTEQVKKQKALIKANNSEVSKLSKEKDALSRKIADAQLEIQQLEHDMKGCAEKVADAEKKVKHMLDKYKWISGQRRYFGAPNSEFDFSKFDPQVAGPRLKELQEKKDRMQNKINTKANNMLQDVEVQYKSLLEKRKTVISDKSAIENVIKELDEKKKVALAKACEQVNKDFGSIFKTLLPGTDAKLLPQPGTSVLDGLEFRVAFGDVWKESLSELSGGQKSLLALSLILALLLFNPAPIYILDEVDAALDLSHTQNIGKMLRMHFKSSQFIIVSLKDGMFNNANVLFRTKFVDGVSSVERSALRQHQNGH